MPKARNELQKMLNQQAYYHISSYFVVPQSQPIIYNPNNPKIDKILKPNLKFTHIVLIYHTKQHNPLQPKDRTTKPNFQNPKFPIKTNKYHKFIKQLVRFDSEGNFQIPGERLLFWNLEGDDILTQKKKKIERKRPHKCLIFEGTFILEELVQCRVQKLKRAI